MNCFHEPPPPLSWWRRLLLRWRMRRAFRSYTMPRIKGGAIPSAHIPLLHEEARPKVVEWRFKVGGRE